MDDALRPSLSFLRDSNVEVLILVLMDDALRLAQNLYKLHNRQVLILVLMDDALRHSHTHRYEENRSCLNPCFNG